MNELVELARQFLGQKPKPDPGRHGPASQIGRVVMVEAKSGHKALAVIECVTIIEDRPYLKPGRWLWITANGTKRCVHDSLVVDLAPSCPRCQTSRWWWTEEGQIRCARCYPPAPDWQKAWKNLAALTDGILPDDPHRSLVLTLVHACDESFKRGDWPAFQQAVAQVRLAVQMEDER